MLGEILITKKTLSQQCKKNQKEAKKSEINVAKKSKPKIYKMLPLNRNKVINLCSNNKPAIKPLTDSSTVILDKIKSSGLKGLSGGGFPTAEKINAVLDKHIKHKIFIINAIECDAGLIHDEWLIHNQQELISYGIEAVKKICAFDKVILASRHNVNIKNADCVSLDYGYPLGEEHTLIKKLLNIDIPTDIPVCEKGILVLNVQTVFTIGLIMLGEKCNGRYLTVADFTKGDAYVVKAPYGTLLSEILVKACGENKEAQAYTGSGAMNAYKFTDDETVSYSTNLICYSKPLVLSDKTACIGCGKCMRKCPKHLSIPSIMKPWENKNKNRLFRFIQSHKYGGILPEDVAKNCIGCRACTYFCTVGANPEKIVSQEKFKTMP